VSPAVLKSSAPAVTVTAVIVAAVVVAAADVLKPDVNPVVVPAAVSAIIVWLE
jgi:hypothetical protein